MSSLVDKSTSLPLEFVPTFGTNFDLSKFKGTTLIMPTLSAGMNAMLACDMYILNENPTKVGYLKSDYISPMVSNDALT